MNNFRNQSIYISSECQFMLGLYVKKMVAGTDGQMTLDQAADALIINQLSNENPSWTVAFREREELRQAHKKQLQKIEDEVLKLSPELTVNRVV